MLDDITTSRKPIVVSGLTRGACIFQISRSHIKVLSARRVTWSKFPTEYMQILSTTIQNLVATVTWHPGFVHLWF